MIGKKDSSGFCKACNSKIIRIRDRCCLKCGKYLLDDTKELCNNCINKKYYFRQGKAAFLYTGPMKTAMYRFKYANRRSYATAFATEMIRSNEGWIRKIKPDVIIPVPMYRKKEKRRGYNQASVLAREIGKITGVPVDTGYVVRIRNTVPMKSLSEYERKRNLFKAFKINGNGVKYKSILLVDDIFTTGATLNHIAEILTEWTDEIYVMSVCAGADK